MTRATSFQEKLLGDKKQNVIRDVVYHKNCYFLDNNI